MDPNGNPVSPALAIALTQAAVTGWTGTFGEYETRAVFASPDATLVTVVCFPGAGISNTSSVGGNDIQLFLGGYRSANGTVTPYTPVTLRQTFIHEVGHSLGAIDHYSRSTGLPEQGHTRDLMGSVSVANSPQAGTIREILIFNGIRP